MGVPKTAPNFQALGKSATLASEGADHCLAQLLEVVGLPLILIALCGCNLTSKFQANTASSMSAAVQVSGHVNGVTGSSSLSTNQKNLSVKAASTCSQGVVKISKMGLDGTLTDTSYSGPLGSDGAFLLSLGAADYNSYLNASDMYVLAVGNCGNPNATANCHFCAGYLKHFNSFTFSESIVGARF